jgi:peptide deformylase
MPVNAVEMLMTMKVLKYPHPVLKRPCKPIQRINQELRDIVAEMFETMYAAAGVGLAANQVGLPLQLFVMNASGNAEETSEEYVFINPVILKRNGNAADNEGCLSFPDIHADVIRAETIDVESISLSGEIQRFKWNGRMARIVQHETDHLHGIEFVDRLSETGKTEIRALLEELRIVFAGDERLGFISKENIQKEIESYEKKFC